MNPKRSLVFVGTAALVAVVLAALVIVPAFGGTDRGAAAPATPAAGGTTGQGQGTTPVYDDFVNKLAANLGITDPTKVDQGIRTTLKQMIDERQAAGQLTADQAAQLKQDVDAGNFPRDLLGLAMQRHERHGHGHGHKRARGQRLAGLKADFNELATFFGESPEALKTELKGGDSLATIAGKHGKTRDELKTELTTLFETKLKTAQDAGRITPDQATQLRQRFQSHLDQLIDRVPGAGRGANQPATPAPAATPAL